MTQVCNVNYVLPREGGNSPSVPGLEPRDMEGAVGGGEREEGRSWGDDCQASFQLPPPPHPAHPPAAATTSCPAGGRELVGGGGHSPRTQVRHPFPTSFSSRVGRLPFALGLAPGTLALSLEHSSANTVLDTSLPNSAPHPAPAQSGTCSVPDQSPIPGLAQLSIDN